MRVHQAAQPIGTRDAPVEGQEATQERQACIAPVDDVLVIVAGRNRAADHQQQNLGQRVSHPPRITKVAQARAGGLTGFIGREDEGEHPLRSPTAGVPCCPAPSPGWSRHR